MKYFVIFLLITITYILKGQNPYASIGKQATTLTLSNGKYTEYFANDTLVEIGSVVFNTITGKVVGFVERDTLYSEYSMEPEVMSRWLTPDPLAHEFYDWSPYNYGKDNPILFIDPDGRFASPYYDKEGNYLGVDENGFEGEIYITDQQTFDKHSKDGVASSSDIQGDENTTALQNSDGLGLEAQSKIYTHVLNQMDDIDFSRLYNGKVSIYSGKYVMRDGQFIGKGFNDPDRYPRHGTGKVGNSIKVTTRDGNYSSDLYTVESIQNYLGVHEYKGHGAKGHSGGKKKGGTHWKAYRDQYKHATYKKLPTELRNEVYQRILEYMQVEDPALYNKLKKK